MNRKKNLTRNFNPTGKEVFVVYQCPTCGRNDCSIVPPKMKTKLPFFVQCGCGGYVMYHRAWIAEPYKASDLFIGFVSGDSKIVDALASGKLKEVTDKLDPDGTMMDMSVMMGDQEFWKDFVKNQKDKESKESMYV